MELAFLIALLSFTASKVFAFYVTEVEKNHLYTWEEKQVDGTFLYYGLELGMKGEWKERSKLWYAYSRRAEFCARNYFRFLIQKKCVPEDFPEYVDPRLKERIDKALSERADAIKPQISSFGTGYAGQSHGKNIAYISRKPIRHRMELPDPRERSLTLQEFYDHYNDIVMTVWVNPYEDGSVVYHNRGIFRNAFSMLFDSYKDLSIKIHGFSALVMQEVYKSQFLFVCAAPPMCRLLLRAFDRKDLFYLEDRTPAQPSDFAKTVPEGFDCGGVDTRLGIKTETLKKKLLEKSPREKELKTTVIKKSQPSSKRRLRETLERTKSGSKSSKTATAKNLQRRDKTKRLREILQTAKEQGRDLKIEGVEGSKKREREELEKRQTVKKKSKK